MAEHAHNETPHGSPARADGLELGGRGRSLMVGAVAVGGIGLLAGALVDALGSDAGFRRFFFAYLVGFAWCLSIALGALFFVLLQHLTRAGWSVSVRRVAEALSATLPYLAALSLPLVISVLIGNGALYPWAQPLSHAEGAHHDAGGATKPAAGAHGAAGTQGTPGAAGAGAAAVQPGPSQTASPPAPSADKVADTALPSKHKGLDELTLAKRAYLNPWFFLLRLVLYFVVWTLIAWRYWKLSIRQDASGDAGLTERLETTSAPAMLLYAVTVTFASIDLLMSLDPHWYSTIFGVYFFSGGVIGFFATMVIALGALQRQGLLRESVSVEHYHDLGKFLFAFTFFWGYIAFSQYMLLWYANLPETTGWLIKRGASTAREHHSAWTAVSLVLLFGKLLIPFAGLLSRHVKRNLTALTFWAVWLLVFHAVDVFWLVMPELYADAHAPLPLGVVEVAAFVGVAGLFVAGFVKNLGAASLRPVRDPRLDEALAFQNI